MSEWDEVVQVVNTVGVSADNRDWEGCRACFAPEVQVDYTSLFGGERETVTADELVRRWRSLLPGFTATQHLIGSHVGRIDGNTTRCQAHFIATHIGESGTWVLGGTYHYTLQKDEDAGMWLIYEMVMTSKWSDGDHERLIAEARTNVTD